ncbi:hypothetical protein CONLIGDRAFT_577319 [Coniochaeta ligniaria NRRL 30616]|uniref:Methyltransferase n=1 Tax=Coniochaeta ligniaria NRRL 30616 TaxID=1408157 RepID=A0A1J7IMH9_9PEZI|nr:hypothetical protein CONLIGDRAFT_577319 [Coniochaeta ligniaria NRRL 30616]
MLADKIQNKPSHELVRLRYLQWDDKFLTEKPFQLYADIPADSPSSLRGNVSFEEGEPEKIHDVRGCDHEFTLDGQGFKFINLRTDFANWDDPRAVQNGYYQEMETVLQDNVEGADHVHIFEHRVNQVFPVTHLDLGDASRYLSPAGTVHIDLTAWEVLEKIKVLAGGDKDQLARLRDSRVRVINIWRPLHGDITSWPLAVSDGSRIHLEDLIAVDQVRRHSRGEGYVIRYRPGLEWYYLSHMTREEALLLKNFDSADVPAKFAAHAAFRIPWMGPEPPRRTSVEVRALVFSFT